MDANMISLVGTIYASTAIGVGVILAAAGLGSALGWSCLRLQTRTNWQGE